MDKEKYPYKTSELFKGVQFISGTIKGDNPSFLQYMEFNVRKYI